MVTLNRNYIFIMMSILTTSCNDIGTANFDGLAIGTAISSPSPTTAPTTEAGVNPALTYSGLTSITLKTDTTLRLTWPAHASAVDYDVFNTITGTAVLFTTVSGQSSTGVNLTGLTPGESYRFRVRIKDAQGLYDGNTHDIAATMETRPLRPSALSLQTPAASPGVIARPTIRVSGVKDGDTVTLYSDSNCTTSLGSEVATADTVDIRTSVLTSGVSTTIYANATNSVPTASLCSLVSVSYHRDACPAQYVAVTHNTAVGTTADFCVMKYEARALKMDATPVVDTDGCLEGTCVTSNWASLYHPTSNPTGYRPESTGTGAPWKQISQNNAKTACENIGTGYALISNAEWMTVARDIERVNTNWTPHVTTGVQVAGVGSLNTGWARTNNSRNALVSDSTCLYNSATTTCGATGNHLNKRTHDLSSGESIWDIVGNVWEWVDWQITCTAGNCHKAYVGTDGGPSEDYKEYYSLTHNVSNTDQMSPETWQPYFSSLGGTNGMGLYRAGTNSSGGAPIRGGNFNRGAEAGVYTLALTNVATTSNIYVGFRCVYRPSL